MSWLTPYPMQPIGDDHWIMLQHAIYKTRSGELIHVPKGFLTDLASIPQVIQNVIPVNGRHRGPSVLHDLGFVIQDRSFMQVNKLFLEAMADSGVNLVLRYAMFSAVSTGGRLPWLRNKRDREDDVVKFLARYNLGPAAVSVGEVLKRNGLPMPHDCDKSLDDVLALYNIDPAAVKRNDASILL